MRWGRRTQSQPHPNSRWQTWWRGAASNTLLLLLAVPYQILPLYFLPWTCISLSLKLYHTWRGSSGADRILLSSLGSGKRRSQGATKPGVDLAFVVGRRRLWGVVKVYKSSSGCGTGSTLEPTMAMASWDITGGCGVGTTARRWAGFRCGSSDSGGYINGDGSSLG